METEMKSGKDPKQAFAVASSVQRRSKKAEGGKIERVDKQKAKDMSKGALSGGPTMAQGIQNVKKALGFAEGGPVSAKSEKRPMPDDTDNDAKSVRKNSGNKPAKNDSWTDDITVKQAQKPSITPLSQPKLIGSDAFSVRRRQQRDDNNDQESAFGPNNGPQQQPKEDYNEVGANRQGPHVSALDMKMMAEGGQVDHNSMAQQHLAMYKKHRMMAEGGMIDPQDDSIEMRERNDEANMQSQLDPSEDMGESDANSRNEIGGNRQGPSVDALKMKMMSKGGEISPDDEIEMMAHDSLAAAIMSRRKRLAEGGEVSNDEINIMDNGREYPNPIDKRNEAILKENLDSDMEGVDQPEDSNLIGDDREDESENEHDASIVGSIRSKMKRRRFIE